MCTHEHRDVADAVFVFCSSVPFRLIRTDIHDGHDERVPYLPVSTLIPNNLRTYVPYLKIE